MNFSNKKIILTFVGCYLPGFRGGGPIRTIANMVNLLGDEFDFNIVTGDRDIGDLKSYSSIKINDWNSIDKAQVFYLRPGIFSFIYLFINLINKSFDVLYLNSFFSIRFSFVPLLLLRIFNSKIPVILGPRGEFSNGALNIKSFKKLFFIAFIKFIGLHKNVIWHASTAYEACDIRRVMSETVSIRTAVDLTIAEDNFDMPVRNSEFNLNIIFISRISPMKNLLGALMLLQKVRQKICFHVYGPIEDKDYWLKCHDAAKLLPQNVVYSYLGALQPTMVAQTLAKYDLFLLPTFGENYGHVIAEALSVGLPVLISDATPWRDLVKNNVGWDVSINDLEKFVACIEECCGKSPGEYEKWRLDIRDWAKKNISNQNAVDENRLLFSNLN